MAVPLAIELAAARVEALGLGQLLDRLDDRFTLLTSSARTAPARQRSLAATVDWSYQLLSDQEKQMFRRLAIFSGPFSLDAAETVAGAAAGPAVLKLVDCSLLTPPRTGPDGRGRYLMLETLRAFGLDRLTEAGERPGAEALLAQHMLAVAERAAAGMAASATEVEAGTWLDAEDATMHQALVWALEHDPHGSGPPSAGSRRANRRGAPGRSCSARPPRTCVRRWVISPRYETPSGGRERRRCWWTRCWAGRSTC
jgi:predicted ATPase